MRNIERIHEVLSGSFDEDYFRTRLKEGWRLAGVHWEREVETEAAQQERWIEEVPYGLRVSDDCEHLEENPVERRALGLMLKLISGDKKMSQIADELNSQGFRTRRGTRWTQTAVFNMLPRLIEAAPQVWRLDTAKANRS